MGTPTRRATFVVNLGAEGVTASAAYVLIDLSDSTNFPHVNTGAVDLLSLALSAETKTDGQYDIWVGVVTENDAVNGSATWLHCFHCENRDNATDDTGHFYAELDFTAGGCAPDGLRCEVASDALLYCAGNQNQAGHVNWKIAANLASPVSATNDVAAGDVVVWAEEAGGAGALDFSLTAIYTTHA